MAFSVPGATFSRVGITLPGVFHASRLLQSYYCSGAIETGDGLRTNPAPIVSIEALTSSITIKLGDTAQQGTYLLGFGISLEVQ